MRSLIMFLFFIMLGTTFAQYQCDWNVISGGAGNLTSTNFQSQATAIQTAIGSLTSTNFLGFIGFWQRELGMPGISEEKNDEISDINNLVAKLYSAKPNPFKSQTAIRYSIPAEGKVSLLIYDISGRLVRTLVDENKQSGIHNINWDSKNDRNQTVSSGIYFYKFQTPNYSETKKLLLIE